MKPFFVLLLAAAVLAARPAHGQGMLAIGPRSDFASSVPLTFSVNGGGGYDHTDYPDIADVDSFFLYGGVGLLYGNDNRVTKWNVGADFGVLHYLDDTNRGEDMEYNARLSFNISHEFNRRLSLSDNFYVTYETEPDYGIGASASRRAGQYVYAYNNLSVAYAWSERVATTTGYSVEAIRYDDELQAQAEDRVSHLFSQDISYALSRRSKLVFEYRYRITDYRHDGGNGTGDDGEDTEDGDEETEDGGEGVENPDYTSHYILVGVDQAWSDRTNFSVRAGAEFYQSDRADETAPYVEASISYALSRQTTARFYTQAGYDGAELGDYDSRYSYRAGVVADHQFTSRLSGSAGVHYVHSEFGGNDTIEGATDDEVNASVGLSYNLWNNVSVDASYSFTTISSDAEFHDYDQQRVSLGLNATF